MNDNGKQSPVTFPPDFLWGAATSSYQIEGAATADGKGPSIWDTFTRVPGAIRDGSSGDMACDHYQRWEEDIELMRRLGLQAYRFSIAWPRVLPEGTGPVNQAGLDFYSRLVDGLLEAGIVPFVTLYHWDLPQALQDAGGWPSRATADAFVNYADIVSRALGDRVVHWTTFNEPFVSAHIGHLEGRHAPGERDVQRSLAAAHHLLLAHGHAVPVIRYNVPEAQAGIVLNLSPCHAASADPADRRAAELADGILNRWYLNPLAGRPYPTDVAAHYGSDLPFVRPGDMAAIAAPLDFLGINYYFREIHRAPDAVLPQTVVRSAEITAMDWEVYPEGLYETLVRVHQAYDLAPALYVTENGAAFPDAATADGRVDDPARCRFLTRHLAQAARAIEAGVPLRGYFAWSLLDNFEWEKGYTMRFGLVYVDYETQRRIPKSSARLYRAIIQRNGLPTTA